MISFKADFDYIIIGGGFYGCCLALFLRSITKRVLLVEAEEKLMNRASRVNQARIHTGFHYPRSAVTAVKSMMLHQRFIEDFSEAVVDDFQMIYGIARRRSKISAKRFYRMFRDLGAPIKPSSPTQKALFDKEMIEDCFSCFEVAFDHSILKRKLTERLDAAGVEVRLSTELTELVSSKERVTAQLSDGTELTARYAFNITYSQVNNILSKADLPLAPVKHELSEIALIKPPSELEKLGVTIMDGPFLSCMPYPSENLHSLTHVRYTPHKSWTGSIPKDVDCTQLETHAMHMIRDAQRYLPCLSESQYNKSIYEVKTVLVKNEHDDGRPILYQQKPEHSRVISILGGKIDNIYDLFDLVKSTDEEFAGADDSLIIGK
nr:FAD-dependent oxidoreductase [Cytophagales bacterium]